MNQFFFKCKWRFCKLDANFSIYLYSFENPPYGPNIFDTVVSLNFDLSETVGSNNPVNQLMLNKDVLFRSVCVIINSLIKSDNNNMNIGLDKQFF